jgi:hypothetical protein
MAPTERPWTLAPSSDWVGTTGTLEPDVELETVVATPANEVDSSSSLATCEEACVGAAELSLEADWEEASVVEAAPEEAAPEEAAPEEAAPEEAASEEEAALEEALVEEEASLDDDEELEWPSQESSNADLALFASPSGQMSSKHFLTSLPLLEQIQDKSFNPVQSDFFST